MRRDPLLLLVFTQGIESCDTLVFQSEQRVGARRAQIDVVAANPNRKKKRAK